MTDREQLVLTEFPLVVQCMVNVKCDYTSKDRTGSLS